MNDQQIVQLFWERNDRAIEETRRQYGAYCLSIARNILFDALDAEEAVQDTWMAAWNSIPPNRPALLRTYLGKLTRRIALKQVRGKHALKRGGGETALVLDELAECTALQQGVEKELDEKQLTEAIERFLAGVREQERRVFICRYWYLEPVEHIAQRFGYSQSKVKSLLHRLRLRLRSQLVREGLLDEE